MLEQLVIEPQGGLSNRVRVITSGIRIAERYAAQLTLVFPEGDPRELFELPDHIRVVQAPPAFVENLPVYRGISHDFSTSRIAYYRGWSRFCPSDEPTYDFRLYAKYAKPSQQVLRHLDELRSILKLPDDYISMHIRRGDHARCRQWLPDDLVMSTLRRLVSREPQTTIAIACEDITLRTRLKEAFPEQVIIASQKKTFWKRVFEIPVVSRDYAELLLLSRGRFVIGTLESSYSDLMIAYNGNRASHWIGSRPAPLP